MANLTGMSRVMGLLIAVVVIVAPLGSGAHSICDWAQYGHDAGHSFRADGACSTIDMVSAPTMHLKWFVPTPDSVTASPAVVDGTVFVGGWDGRFRALDAASGAERWHVDIDDSNDVAFGRIVSSAAVAGIGSRDVVIVGGGSTVYVLDADSGAELDAVCVDPRTTSRCAGSSADIEVESSPAVVDVDGETWVIVGHDVHNRSGIGRTGIIAFRLEADATLTTLWKFDPETLLTYTPSNSADPLTEGAGQGHGCAGVWSSPAIDVDADRVFFGTSSCSGDPAFNPGESMFGISLRTGEYVWHESPLVDRGEGTKLDDDFGASPNLLPGGAVGFGGKDGWYYARGYDGAKRWDSHAGQAGHATTNFAVGGMIGTAAVGSVAGEPAIFATTALSTPIDRPFDEAGPDPDERLLDDPGRMFSLHAIAADDGEILWRTPLSRQSYGAPTLVNGVVIVPSTFDFTVKAFDANTGSPLWAHPLIGATSSTPVIVGNTIYFGSGTRTTDGEYKAFQQLGEQVPDEFGPHPLSPLSGIWAFEII